MNVRIEIDTKTFVRFWLVVIGFALVALAIYNARQALIIIGISMFLAIALNPPVNRLAKIFPSKSRVLGTALAYLAVVAVLGAVIFLVIPPIVDQTSKFVESIPSLVDNASNQSSGVSRFIEHYQLQSEVDSMLISIKDGATQFASSAGTFLITSIGSVISAIFAIVLVLVLTFLMLIEGPAWLNKIWNNYGDKKRMAHHRDLTRRMYTVVNSYVVGQLMVSSIAGLASGLTVFILSLIFSFSASLAIPAAVLILVSSLIPLFGATVGAILVGLILLLNNITAAIIFIVFFVIYQQVEANYISPKIQAKRTDLSALIILVSITVGIYLFGIIGGIISIPIAGSIKVLLEDYFARSKEKHASKALDKTVTTNN